MKNTNLIKARKSKGFTQDQLAKKLGYKGKQSVANWENNHISPPLETAIKISQLLEKDIFYLFGGEVQDSQTKKQAVM